MGFGDSYGFFGYASDNGKTYAVKLSFGVAAQGGFNQIVDPQNVTPWPYGIKNLRHVYGSSSSGRRTRLPLFNVANTLYVSGGSFTLHETYAVEGAIGEKRALNQIK